MQRHRRVAADHLIDVVAFFPWWVGVVLAIISYLLFSHWAQQPVTATVQTGQVAIMVKQQILQTASGVLRYVVPGLCLFAAALSWSKRRGKR